MDIVDIYIVLYSITVFKLNISGKVYNQFKYKFNKLL